MTRAAEVGAVAQADAALLEFSVRVVEAKGGDVEPDEEAGLRTLAQDDAGHGLDFLLDEVEVAAEILHAREAPGLTVVKRGLGGGEAEHVLVERKALKDATEARAQAGVGDDRETTGEAGDVEGLAGGHQRDRK